MYMQAASYGSSGEGQATSNPPQHAAPRGSCRLAVNGAVRAGLSSACSRHVCKVSPGNCVQPPSCNRSTTQQVVPPAALPHALSATSIPPVPSTVPAVHAVVETGSLSLLLQNKKEGLVLLASASWQRIIIISSSGGGSIINTPIHSHHHISALCACTRLNTAQQCCHPAVPPCCTCCTRLCKCPSAHFRCLAPHLLLPCTALVLPCRVRQKFDLDDRLAASAGLYYDLAGSKLGPYGTLTYKLEPDNPKSKSRIGNVT